MSESEPRLLCDGKHIRLVARGKWEFAERKKVSGIVGIVAVTDQNKLILVEQFRAPVNKRVIELPVDFKVYTGLYFIKCA
jgi:ADP-ribose pyrophosphatase